MVSYHQLLDYSKHYLHTPSSPHAFAFRLPTLRQSPDLFPSDPEHITVVTIIRF